MADRPSPRGERRRLLLSLGASLAILAVVVVAVVVLVRLAAPPPPAPVFTGPEAVQRERATHSLLIVLAVPFDLWSPQYAGPDPALVDPWYAAHPAEWFRGTLAPALRDYFRNLTYGRYTLGIDVAGWHRLPRPRRVPGQVSYADSRELEIRDVLEAAQREKTNPFSYDFVVVVDPTSPFDPRFQQDWNAAQGVASFHPWSYRAVNSVLTGVYYSGNGYEGDPLVLLLRGLAHELSHALDYRLHGRQELYDNLGDRWDVMGPLYGGNPPYSPPNERILLDSRLSPLGPFGQTVRLEPRENGPGRAREFSVGNDRFTLEHRRVCIPRSFDEDHPCVLLWHELGGPNQRGLEPGGHWDVPGEYPSYGLTVTVSSLEPAGANVSVTVRVAR
ncbi:MAG: hypothetical protein HY558_05485 [Euryarchaeota archaeon]|nr:hypothetical protein [Euryarchaeota archaeon]